MHIFIGNIFSNAILQCCFVSIVVSLALISDINGQTELDSILVRRIEKDVDRREKRIARQVRSGEIAHEIIADYQLEEYRIDEYLYRKIERDNSIGNYVIELMLAEKRYQLLLSKYLQILKGILDDEDQKILVNAQSRWRSYRRFELELNKRINPEAYDLPKIPIENIAERHLDITKYRVAELVDYIARMKEE